MKRIIVLILALTLMLAAFASCGKTPEETTSPTETGATTAPTGTGSTTAPTGTEATTEAGEPAVEPTQNPEDEIIDAFVKAVQNNPAITAEELANELIKVRYLKNFEVMKAEYYYPGFDYSFTPAAKEAYCIIDNYSPRSNLAYVFELEDGADSEAFVKSLEENVEMNWNYNDNPADKGAHVVIGNFVFFMVYNDTLGDVDDAPVAKKERDIVDIFRAYLSEHPTATALEIANYINAHQHVGQLYTQTVEEGRLTGISTYLEGFSDGAIFSPMMMPSTFIGYVFKVAEGGDIDAFATTVKNNANVAWNVCVVVNTVIVETDGNYVIFMMCNE